MLVKVNAPLGTKNGKRFGLSDEMTMHPEGIVEYRCAVCGLKHLCVCFSCNFSTAEAAFRFLRL